MNNKQSLYLNKYTEAAPLAVFRILFGLLMFISIIRFWYHGWIEKLYLEPNFHFHYLGFEWVQVPGYWTYALFVICGLSAFSFGIGLFYRFSIVSFFLSFTYIELMDKTTYLNHYYFVSVVAFMLIFIPAHRYFSVDAYRNSSISSRLTAQWHIDALKFFLAIVYIYAGLAKLNTDWMIHALPLKIWLTSKVDIPVIGQFMDDKLIHYLFSWGGAMYDLFIVFFLMWRRTRPFAFFAVLFFHIMTRILFPIGMFPFIMICSTLLFFDAKWHQAFLEFLSQKLFSKFKLTAENLKFPFNKLSLKVVSLVLLLQLILPWRFLLYPGQLFWTEQGYRFSWRVMLIEKTGYANFKIVDGKTGKFFYVQNEDFLTAFQQKQMSTQADFIVEYGQMLGNHFASQGHQNVEVYVESFVSLNGRKSQVFIDPDVDIMTLKNSLRHRTYILPLNG